MESRFFAQRRQRLIEQMGDRSVAILTSPPERQRSHDTNYRYRPSSDILYLTGFIEPEAVVVIAPGHDEGDFVMFVRPRDREREIWDGRRLGPEGAIERHKADAAYTIDQIDEKLPQFLEGRETLYYVPGYDAGFDQKVLGWMNTLRHRRNAPSAAPQSIQDLRDLVHEMRVFKQPEEIELMRRAAEITSEAHILAMKNCRPGRHEFELQATVEGHFLSQGANFPAYTSIVGGGANATILHYVENREELRDGEVVLIDAGCEYHFYAADITRSFPVSGKFTPAQRDIYEAVLEAQVAAIEDVAAGRRYRELQDRTAHRLTESLVQLGLLSGSVDALIEDESYKRYYPHKVGHYLGIDVHDVGSYYDPEGESRLIAPGMVLTIEPGIYVPQDDENAPEAMRGVGVRIEDDILVTADGRENLTASCPKTVEEIEALVGTA